MGSLRRRIARVRRRILSTGGPTDAAVLLDRVSAVERAVDPTARLHLVPNAVAASAAELSPTTELSAQGTDGVILLFFGPAAGPSILEPRPRQSYMVYAVSGDLHTFTPTPIQIGRVEFDAESASLLSSPTSWRPRGENMRMSRP